MKSLAFILLGFLTCTASAAQSQDAPLKLQVEKAPSATRRAGVYHLATGTWTRSVVAQANFGPDVIFSNTAMSSYFSAAGATGDFAPGSTNYDEGLIPTVDNPNYPAANRTSYEVNCVTIGYCDLNPPGTSGWELTFYDSYTGCARPDDSGTTVMARGLPADGCWVLSLDLTGSDEFCLAGDGGDGYQGVSDEDSFSWSSKYAGSDGSMLAGFYLAGDPLATDLGWTPGTLPTAGANTYYGPASLCSPAAGVEAATGNHSRDFWFLDDPAGVTSNCFFFGGYLNNVGCGGPSNPFASRYIELGASLEECVVTPIGFPYCQSNPTSTGVQSTLSIFGSTSVVADEVEITAFLPVNTIGFFLTSLDPGFVPNAGGSNGNLCLGGAIGRFQQLAKLSGANGEITISTLVGEWSIGDLPHPMTSYAAVPGTSSHFQLWFRENTTFPSSNFSQGVRVTWTP
jgi:hypothetical protein